MSVTWSRLWEIFLLVCICFLSLLLSYFNFVGLHHLKTYKTSLLRFLVRRRYSLYQVKTVISWLNFQWFLSLSLYTSSTVQGRTSHKCIDPSGNPILRMYYTSMVRRSWFYIVFFPSSDHVSPSSSSKCHRFLSNNVIGYSALGDMSDLGSKDMSVGYQMSTIYLYSLSQVLCNM